MKRHLPLLLLAACGDGASSAETCAIADGPTPDSVAQPRCAPDYARPGDADDPLRNSARTRSLSVDSDPQEDAMYLLDTEKWWLHFDFVWFVLEGHAPLGLRARGSAGEPREIRAEPGRSYAARRDGEGYAGWEEIGR